MCDAYLGRVLDVMDDLDLWRDTMLIVTTDHGTLLGEHGWWAKAIQPFYEELARIPLFIWDPRCGRRDDRCDCLVQNVHLAATLLEYFGMERPPTMQGAALRETIASDVPVREAALFGMHGAHVNCTDGRYVYMRAPASPENAPLHDYTLMPTHMRSRFSVRELRDAELAGPFTFTKGCPVLKVKARPLMSAHEFGNQLFDLQQDPEQKSPIADRAIEMMMVSQMIRLMKENDAPLEQFERLGLPL
jgi:hypothetical protein